MSNHLNETEKKILSDVLIKHLDNFKDAEVLLFGSMAGGNPRPTSDIDIAIKLPQALDKGVWSKIEEDLSESGLLRKVDVVDYHRVNTDFQKVIDKSGQRILASKVHRYRLCPSGYHWVSAHDRRIPPSLRRPTGGIAEVDGHCRLSSGGDHEGIREILTADEIEEMFDRFGRDMGRNLKKFADPRKRDWNRFDDNIVFWTNFWNEIFDPKTKMEPKFVKALVGSESGFDVAPPPQMAGKSGLARGLVQITDEALRVLTDPKSKEIGDFKFQIDQQNIASANVSLAAGIRWLFHKKRLADIALNRESTWEEALLNYKGYLPEYKKDKTQSFKGLVRFKELYEELN